MHELSVTQSMLSIVLEKAHAAKASQVRKINLVVGELSGIVDDCLQFYFELLSRDTIAAGATLSFNKPPVRLRCRNCDAVFSTENGGWICPQCRQPNIEIISGHELSVESIEVD